MLCYQEKKTYSGAKKVWAFKGQLLIRKYIYLQNLFSS